MKRAQNIWEPGIAWAHLLCAPSSDSICNGFSQEYIVFASQDFAGEMGHIVCPQLRLLIEFGEGSTEGKRTIPKAEAGRICESSRSGRGKEVQFRD